MVDDYMLDNGIIKEKGHLGADIFANLIKNISRADEIIEKAYDEINKHDELDRVYYESFDEDIRQFQKCRWEYDEFTGFADEYDAMVDSKFTSKMEQLCNKLSDIRLEDIQIDNNLGIVDQEGSHYDTFGGTRLKYKINIKDVLNVDCVDKALRTEYEERRQMVESMQKMVEEDNWPEGIGEDTKEIIRKYVSALNGGKLESYDDSINKLLTQGEFNFITQGEQNISLALDILPLVGDVKGIAESIRGKEFITGRELSDAERAMSGVSSLVGFIPGVGEIGTIAKAGEKLGAKAVLKEAAKYTVKETLQGAGMYGATSIASDLGITPRQQIMAMGGFSLYRGGKAVLKNPMVKSAINNSADIAKATVKDAILADSGRIVLNAGIGGQGKQLYNSFKKVTAERKALREGIAIGKTSITRVSKNINNIKLKRIDTKENIKYNLIKDYVRDIETRTGIKLPKNQVEELKNALRSKEYEKLTPKETIRRRNEFNKVKNSLIEEWESNTGKKWPTYTEDVVSSNTGRIVRKVGDKYDAHHIIENSFGGEHEWWNIHPARFPNEHQSGIHGAGSAASELFIRRK